MGKVVTLVAGALLLGPAIAGLAVFGTIAGVTVTALGVSLSVGALALVGVGLIFSALQPSFDASDSGTQISMAQGAAEPREYVYGKRRTGGSIVYIDTTGADNNTLWIVSVMASHEINAFTKFFIDEKEVTVSAGAVTTAPYNGFVNVYTHMGTAAQTVDTNLDAASSLWTTNHRLRGCAYVIWKLTWDQDVFPGGIPNLSVEIEGKKVWDTRTSTTVYSTNPVLCCLDYMRDSLLGSNIPLGAFETANVNAAANICEETVETVADRYTCAGVINSEMVHAEVISLFEKTMAGSIAYSSGVFRFHPGQWDAPTVSFDEDDILTVSVTPTPSRKDLVNAVKGLFIDPAQSYQPVDYPPKTDDPAETEDGGERFWLDLDLPFTTDHKTAQRIAKIAWERSRRRMAVSMRVNLKGLGVKVMDTIEVTHDNFGWSSKTFRVVEWRMGVVGDDSFACDLVLREDDSTVYSWLESSDLQTFGTVPTTSFFLPFGINLALPGGVAFTSLAFIGADGSSVPGLKLAYNTPAAWIQNIQAQYKLNTEAATKYRPIPNQALIGPDEIHFPAVPEDWDVRVRNLSIFGTYSDWATVSATTAPASDSVPTVGGANMSRYGGKQRNYGFVGFQGYAEKIWAAGAQPADSLAFVETGMKLAVSCELMHDQDMDDEGQYSRFSVFSEDSSNATTAQTTLDTNGDAPNVWHKKSAIFTCPAAASDMDDVGWGIGRLGTDYTTIAHGTVSVRNVKIEHGQAATKYIGQFGLAAYDLADTGQIVDDAVTEPFLDSQTSSQTMATTQNLWQTISGISLTETFPSGVPIDVWVLLSGSARTQDSTGYSINVRVLEDGSTEVLKFTYAWGSNDMTTQSEGSFDFNVPLLGRLTGDGSSHTYTVQVQLVTPFVSGAGGWQAPVGFWTRDSQLVMRRVSK